MRIPILVLTSVVVTSPVSAEPQRVLRGPVPAWVTQSTLLAVPDNVGGPMFIRRQDLQFHLGGKGQAQYLSYRIKILQPSALELGNIVPCLALATVAAAATSPSG